MASAPPASPAARWLRWDVEDRDHHRLVTVTALFIVLAAAEMAFFGLPPVDFHGPLHWVGIMDPLCGGTRAAHYTVTGELALAWRYNPLGILAVVVASLAVMRAAVGLTTRRWLNWRLAWTARRRAWTLAALVLLFVLLEARQQLRADLLMNGTGGLLGPSM